MASSPQGEPPRAVVGALIAASIGIAFFAIIVIMVVRQGPAATVPIIIGTPTDQAFTPTTTGTVGGTPTHAATATATATPDAGGGTAPTATPTKPPKPTPTHAPPPTPTHAPPTPLVVSSRAP